MRVFETYSALNTALDLAPLTPGAFRFTKQYAPAAFRCSVCRQAVPFPLDRCGTGYGLDDSDSFICYPCCADKDRARMIETGKCVLYLTHPPIRDRSYPFADGEITNWPGTLRFPCRVKRGAHNIARTRYDAWFTGPDGSAWHGTQIGEHTQIIRCKRLKTVVNV